ncbi:MAG TPA: tetratricopeptide repeat protein [Opitutaceae bacterium]
MLNSTAARRAWYALSWCSIIGLLAAAPAAWAVDPTLAEMLELGIYSEETKGDLDAAMRLYEQIVAEADANHELAAQAQFRLAMCHHKQGDFAAATAAFETLVRDFPNQGDLVSLANEYLTANTALLPAP